MSAYLGQCYEQEAAACTLSARAAATLNKQPDTCGEGKNTKHPYGFQFTLRVLTDARSIWPVRGDTPSYSSGLMFPLQMARVLSATCPVFSDLGAAKTRSKATWQEHPMGWASPLLALTDCPMVRLLGGVKLTFPFLARPAAFDRNKPPAVVLSLLLPTNPALNTELTDYLLKYERFCYSYMTVALRKKTGADCNQCLPGCTPANPTVDFVDEGPLGWVRHASPHCDWFGIPGIHGSCILIVAPVSTAEQ